ncbi:hypothetical protein WBG78_20310 [Chryseolinea sp. T2]|uniref:hypothetical protein n=1 Tax=Chryseolinea sp. T2 TaxID=3129255 RepID=UPI003077A75D
MKIKIAFAIALISTCIGTVLSQNVLAPGEQPQVTVDAKGVVRLVYGKENQIFFSTSGDNGKSFSTPQLVAEVNEMHLGMTRGPQLATSASYSVVTAMDKKGNIHSFRQDHKTGKWQKLSLINDADGSAPEGLMSISSNDKDNFYAVWLDLREGRKNNICFSSLSGTKWSANKFAYKSPESHVCECCKPSISVKGKTVSIMFRNWLKGSRDLYLTTSSNGGISFNDAQKLGNGTWSLQGCPMDGGGLSIDDHNLVRTAWQRDGVVYYSMPGQQEQRISDGRHVGMNGSIITWQKGADLLIREGDGHEQKVGEGTALEVCELKNGLILAVWEKDDQIVFTTLSANKTAE